MDNDIFDTLYRRYYAPALLYAQSLCRSRHLAEDMVQEAFCRAWLSLPDDVASFRGWLFRVLRNLLIDHQRRQKHLSADDPPEQADTHTALYRALERLPDADRELLTLHCFARLTAAELADTLHMTPAAVRQRLHRARTRLRQNMEEDGYEF